MTADTIQKCTQGLRPEPQETEHVAAPHGSSPTVVRPMMQVTRHSYAIFSWHKHCLLSTTEFWTNVGAEDREIRPIHKVMLRSLVFHHHCGRPLHTG